MGIFIKNNRLVIRRVLGLLLLLLIAVPDAANAAPRFARSTGTWTAVTWPATSCAAGTGAAVPAAGDDVTICPGFTVTLNASTAALNSLDVQGTLTFGNNATARTLTVTGNVTVSGTVNVSNNTITHSFVLGGNLTNSGTFDLVLDGNSLCNTTMNGAGPQIVSGAGATTEFNNVAVTNSLTINSGATVTQTGTLTVGGTLAVSAGTINLNNVVTVTGPTDVTGGTLNMGGAVAGNRTYTGLVTVSGAGNWTNTGNRVTVFQGGITHTGTGNFTNGTGAVTFNTGATQVLDGDAAITFGGTVTVAAGITINRGNTSTVTVTGNLTGGNATTSIWNNDAGTLSYSGAAAPMATGVLNANNAANTVIYALAGAQAIETTTYRNLEFAGSGAKSATAGITVNGNLTFSGAATFTASTFTHNFAGSWIVNTSAATPITVTTTSVMNFNTPTPAAATSIGGTSTATLAFADVNINNTSGVNLNENASFSTGTTPTLTVGAGATLIPAAAVIVSGTGTMTGTGTVQVTRTAAAPTFNAQYTVTTKTLTNLTVEYAGAAAQEVTNAQTYPLLEINNASGVTVTTGNVTVSTLLTLTSGNITTGALVLISTANCAGSVTRVSGHVIGSFRKTVPAGASTCTFEVGSGSNYTPAVLGLAAGTGAGTITASTTGTAHPTPTGSGFSVTNVLNRYWTMTNTTATPAAGTTAAFNYINGTPVDINAGSDTAFVVKRFSAATWTATTAASCTPVSGASCKGISDYQTGAAATGDYWLGEIFVTPPDSFNAVEVGGAITGRIFTKLRSTNFQLDIVAILSNAIYSAFTGSVRVDPVTGGSGGANCGAGSLAAAAALPGVATAVDVAISSGGRVTTPNFNVTTAYPDVRFRIQYPTTSPTIIVCSSDNFTIRPDTLTVTSTDATNTGTSGTPAIKTGANFNLTANGGAGYTGTPSNNSTSKITGTPTAGTLGGSFTPAASNAASGTFFYSEVGNFGLLADAIIDSGFVVAADQGGSDCIASSTSNSPSGGKYGCWIGSTAVAQTTGSSGFGRFIPDNFNVSYNTPVIAPSCTGFSYVGQTFNFTTAPVMTVTARSGTNNGLTNTTTVNYVGSYMKFTNTSLAPAAYDTQAERYLRFDAIGGGATPALDVSQLPATTADPVIGTFTAGVGTFTFSGGSGFSFTRSATTPSAAFDADIALALNVIDGDGVTFATNPASFGSAAAGSGMLFSDANVLTTNDKSIRYGRLRIGGASGSQLLPLRLPVEAQYWNGSVFVTNTLDACTTLVSGNVGLGNFGGSLNTGETTATIVNSPLQSGRSAIRLSAPGTGNQGSVDVTLNLGATGSTNADACNAFAPAATAGNKTHLRGAWCSPPGTYSKDPAARARFGINRGSDQSIYRREQ